MDEAALAAVVDECTAAVIGEFAVEDILQQLSLDAAGQVQRG